MKLSLDDIINYTSDEEKEEDLQREYEQNEASSFLNIKRSMNNSAAQSVALDEDLANFLEKTLNIDDKSLPFIKQIQKQTNPVMIKNFLEENKPAIGKSYKYGNDVNKSITATNETRTGSHKASTPKTKDPKATGSDVKFLNNLYGNMDYINECSTNAIKRVRLERKKREEEELKRIEEERRLKQKQAQREEEERLRVEAEQKKKEEEKIRFAKELALQKEAERQEQLLKEKEDAANKKKEEDAAKEQAKLLDSEKSKASNGIYNPSILESQVMGNKKRISDIKEQIVNSVSQDKELKSILSKHKRKINPKFGQLTSSLQQLQLITNELMNLIDQTKESPLGYQWILNFIAKGVVSQAETEVGIKPEAALPLGKLALNLMCKYPELLPDFLLPRFIKKCPIVIGYTCSIDTEEGRVRMGWKRKSDGRWEDDAKYNERLGGMATLFCTITRLQVPNIAQMVHPLPISNSWHLVSRISNTPKDLLSEIHFVVLGAFWECCAQHFIQCYGNQGAKLLSLISTDLTMLVSDKKYVAAARLRILAETWQSTGSISTFPEMTS